jgi:hypothetical protein
VHAAADKGQQPTEREIRIAGVLRPLGTVSSPF